MLDGRLERLSLLYPLHSLLEEHEAKVMAAGSGDSPWKPAIVAGGAQIVLSCKPEDLMNQVKARRGRCRARPAV